MTTVVVFRAANLSAKRGCERGIVSHPQSASGMARSSFSLLGDARFELFQKPFSCVSKGFQADLSFENAHQLHGHLSKGVDAACAKKLSNRSMS